MTAKMIRNRCFILVCGAAAVAALLLHYQERNSYRCQICWASKDVFQWRLGSWGDFSVPISPSRNRISQTYFRRDFLPISHTHDWMFAQGSAYLFFGTTRAGCAIGGGRYVNQLCQIYESRPDFRTFISQKLVEGSL